MHPAVRVELALGRRRPKPTLWRGPRLKGTGSKLVERVATCWEALKRQKAFSMGWRTV